MNTETTIIRDARTKHAAIAQLKRIEEGQPWRMTLEPYKPRRSLAQNALYWLWLKTIAEHVNDSTGSDFSDDDLHDWFRGKLLPSKVVQVAGEPMRTRKSTRRLSVVEFSEYLNRIDMHCAEHLGLVLPHPIDLYAEAMGGRRAAA